MTAVEGAQSPTAETSAAIGARVDVSLLVLAKLAAGLYVLHAGFSHVSDDDYARTVIAEQLAHAPRLDPSGTSWLPFPFWIVGLAMAAAGRTLAVSRVLAIVLGAASVAAPYVAMRAVGVRRVAALVATAVAMLLPWNAWLGVAMVPEGWTGAVAGAALIAMGSPAARGWVAVALLVASLSRYEAWPACAVFAVVCARRALRSRADDAIVDAEARASSGTSGGRSRDALWAVVAAAGPLLWMAWNAHAHGSAVHFLIRVTSFRRAAGASQMPLVEKLLAYPHALLYETPEAAAGAALALAALFADERMRRRWLLGFVASIAIVAFLVAGDVGDGAPTHHPARALSPVWWLFLAVAADVVDLRLTAILSSASKRARAIAIGVTAVAAFAWCASLPGRWADAPGRTEWDRRDAQITRGLAMRARDVTFADVTPCAYEHFALLAAWGRPERAHVNPLAHTPPTADCPSVVETKTP